MIKQAKDYTMITNIESTKNQLTFQTRWDEGQPTQLKAGSELTLFRKQGENYRKFEKVLCTSNTGLRYACMFYLSYE